MTETLDICVAGEQTSAVLRVGRANIQMQVPPIFLITAYQMIVAMIQTFMGTAAITGQDLTTMGHIHHHNHPASLVFQLTLTLVETAAADLLHSGLIGPQVS